MNIKQNTIFDLPKREEKVRLHNLKCFKLFTVPWIGHGATLYVKLPTKGFDNQDEVWSWPNLNRSNDVPSDALVEVVDERTVEVTVHGPTTREKKEEENNFADL